MTERSPRMLEFVLAGPELVGFVVEDPAASIRLLVPREPTSPLVLPEWNGNEFLDADGSRPALRTFTPLAVDPDAGRLTVQIVRHPGGAISTWAEQAQPGFPVALSGPGRGHQIDPTAARYVLLGDETAIPAIGQLLDAIAPTVPVDATIETVVEGCELALGDHPRASVHWTVNPDGPPGATLIASIRETELPDATHVWAAGEAAAVQAIRRHLFDDRGLDRRAATVRGYWKQR